jgi:hypothetical protein
VGGGCATNSDCIDGLICDRSLPRGMCTTSCTTSADCHTSTGVCAPDGRCYHVCPNCRNNYSCIGDADAGKPYCGIPGVSDVADAGTDGGVNEGGNDNPDAGDGAVEPGDGADEAATEGGSSEDASSGDATEDTTPAGDDVSSGSGGGGSDGSVAVDATSGG